MIQLCNKSDCTGCEACKSICKKNAITMKPVGTLLTELPIIDSDLCEECHACEKVCPVLHPMHLSEIKSAYASISKNPETNKTATSGGVATEISRKIIEEGGSVYGAISKDGRVFHKRCISIDDLNLLKGSKYTKSDVKDTFKEVKLDLHAGHKVAFFGTPCQIAGLKSFLRKDYDDLVTIDLICHGTPSQTLLHNHIMNVAKGWNIDKIVFREDGFHFRLYDGNGSKIYDNNVWKKPFEDAYYTAFCIGACSFRESCYKCQFATSSRISDITIGDFWGLDPYVKFSRSPSGISVVLPITNKGEQLIKSIEENIELLARPIAEAVNGNTQLRHPSKLSAMGRIFRLFFNHGFSLKASLTIAYLPVIPLYYIKRVIKK